MGLGLEMTEAGLFDLRGITLPARLQVNSATLHGLDLGDAVLDRLWLTASHVSDCVFDGASWRDGRVWGCTFESCSFVRTDLRELGVAPEHDSRRSLFRDCAFTKASMRGFVCPGAVYEDCRFEDCKLAKVDFGGSIFRRTRFAGRLSEVVFADLPWDHERFEPNEMEDVDFHDAELYYVEFRNLAMDRVRWPEHPANETFTHLPCVLRRTVDAYEHDERHDAWGISAAMQQTLRWMHPRRRTGVVHRRELDPLADETIELMRRLEHECT